MKIGMTTFGCDGGRSGIGQYVLHLLSAFDQLRAIPSLDIFAYDDETSLFSCENMNVSYHTLGGRWRNPVFGLAWYQTALPRRCRRAELDVMFFPEANRRLPMHVPCRSVGTVHDFSSFHMEQKYDFVRETYIKRALPRLIGKLDRVITVSESSKRDIVEIAGVAADRIVVIPHGVDQTIYHPKQKASSAETPDGERPYILYVSRIEHPGKNHVTLARAFAQVIERTHCDHQLVFAGAEWSRAEEVHAAVHDLGIADRVTFMGYVPSNDLPWLYRNSSIFVFPSLFEGFGMPILEAMASGVPVACSNTSSMPEVAGDAGILFDPHDVDAIADALERFVCDDELRNRCIQMGIERCNLFTWTNTALKTLQTIEEAA